VAVKRQPIHTVDAFADRPFAGNPAAVCVLSSPAPEPCMRDVAREMNLSETAFLHPEDEIWRLRWFTPTVEMDLCGHATLASAHVLWETGVLAPETTAQFATRSGVLTATRRGDWIEMDFPALPVREIEVPPEVASSLGVEIVRAGRSRDDFLVEVPSEQIVRACEPDLGILRKLPARGVIVTSRSATPEFDFVSRFFAPAAGVDEDPVTGSTHCALAPYWAEHLGKTELTAYQASARGGVLRLRLVGDRVRIQGRAVTVMRGELL
jgi:predicted PhzF superfamily epimerase YddE/YHI9